MVLVVIVGGCCAVAVVTSQGMLNKQLKLSSAEVAKDLDVFGFCFVAGIVVSCCCCCCCCCIVVGSTGN